MRWSAKPCWCRLVSQPPSQFLVASAVSRTRYTALLSFCVNFEFQSLQIDQYMDEDPLNLSPSCASIGGERVASQAANGAKNLGQVKSENVVLDIVQ